MTKRHIVIATRESPLAIQQTELIKSHLQTLHPHLSIELLPLCTQADKMLNLSLKEVGGKGLFVKELEEALLDGRADIAIHSMKDVPMDLPSGLCLPVICKREEPRDVLVSNQYRSLAELPRGSVLGTSSLRRQTQIRALRSDIELRNLRGNINTRLNRLDKGDFAAIVLAAAGLKRLNLTFRIRSYLSIEQLLPAAGQGALGIECREEDEGILALIRPLNDEITHTCVSAERALCQRIGGGCMVPIAAYAEFHQETLTLRGLVSNYQGTRILRAKLEGKAKNAQTMGTRVAEELISQGAEKILQEFK